MGVALLPFIPSFLGYLLITIMSFLAMIASTLFTIQMCSAVQQQTPQHLIGKIMAFIMAVSNCASPLGQALYGILFDVFSHIPSIILFVAAIISALVSLYSKKVFLLLEKESAQ